MVAYYNEFDPYAAQWLRNLIAAGLIPLGDVDERSIVDVQASDIRHYVQCHFFAGIGGWSYAARLAGWPDDRPLWTGSCPCQPFSVAGRGAGQADERHLWPEQFRLIAALRPSVWMGEQVAAAVGKDWLDGVSADLEGIGYACGAAVVPACAVDAPHRRDRLWFVADAEGPRARMETGEPRSEGRRATPDRPTSFRQENGGASDLGVIASRRGGGSAWGGASQWINDADGKARRVEHSIRLLAHGIPGRVGRLRAYGNAIVPQVAAEVIAAYMECRP